MSRSTKKGPFVDGHLLEKIVALVKTSAIHRLDGEPT